MSRPGEAMVAWLTGALDEIERVARECVDGTGSPPVWDADGAVVEGDDNMIIYDEGGHGPEQASHIALHDPRAALARVQAERAIVNLHRSEWYEIPDIDGGIPYNAYRCTECDSIEEWPCDTLRWQAYGHRFDAPGWRKEWAPDGMGEA